MNQIYTHSHSTLTDFKINQFLPSIPKGNWLIFQLSPFRVRGKKAEKLYKKLICQRSRTNKRFELISIDILLLSNL
jgi:hypothetical protein